MNFAHPARLVTLFLLSLTLLAGCASQPKPEPTPVVEDHSAATQAIDAASAAIANAKSLGALWRDTEKFLGQAKKALAAGDDESAISLANKARFQADEGVNQYYLEMAKPLLSKLRGYSNLTAAQQAALDKGAIAVANAEGKTAYDLLSTLKAELDAANIQYTVIKGDSLWSISGKAEIYNNPYQWPLIYKANSDKIKDADLIYPGQDFSIDRNPSAAEVDAAVNHAKTRGAWSLGEVEESDRHYLGGLKIR